MELFKSGRMRLAGAVLAMAITVLLAPRPAAAQQDDAWAFRLIPFYLWAMETSGEVQAGPVTVPVSLSFADAADNLSGAFSFHFEASRGRWGLLSDLNFVGLSSEAEVMVGPAVVDASVDLDLVIFEAGASFLANEAAALGVIGGLRTYTLSPRIDLATSGAGATVVDESRTSANAFVGVMLRPRLAERWTLIGQADIGGGDADLTWSAASGVEYRFRPWGGLLVGYKGLGIDVEGERPRVRRYDVTHDGPFFAFSLHWGGS